MEKLFHFSVRNDRTGETIQFKGQGENLPDAFKDGYKLMGDTFRPKNDGKARDPMTCNVTTADGVTVLRTLREWEGDVPHGVVEVIDVE
jgi:hypothetical protein